MAEYISRAAIMGELTSSDMQQKIKAMTDEELAWYLARMLATYTAELYDGRYVPSDEAVCEIKDNLFRQLSSPAGSPTGQKG